MTVIRAENLGKKYKIRHQNAPSYYTVRDKLTGSVKSFGRSIKQAWSQEKSAINSHIEDFWALKDIDFTVNQGDRLGIIGRNGAGKSTLLKVLSRITEPSVGRIILKGRVASLLEVGTGFHPELTGRENIYLNGAILGMGKEEINRKFDEIVAFAEVAKFLDTPVKRYSSGMYVRLAFAVAAHLEPEILIVDEVLAVGDIQFQQKCLGKMESVAQEGRTVLFVSHNMGVIQSLCTRGILLGQGEVLVDDTAEAAVSYYLRNLEDLSTQSLLERKDRKGRGQVRLSQVDVISKDGSTALATGRPARFLFEATGILPGLYCTFTVYDQLGQPVINFNSTVTSPQDLKESQLGAKFICEVDELLLVPGQYRMNVMLRDHDYLQDHVEGASTFEVEPGEIQGRSINSSSYGSICMGHRWIVPV